MVSVKLLAYTQMDPSLRDVVPEGINDGEYLCAIAARNTITDKDPESLLRMSSKRAIKTLTAVLNYGHTSIVEHLSFTFLVWDFSRIISQQLTRHRIASFSQRGQRYVKVTRKNVIVPKTISKDETLKERFFEAVDKSFEAYNFLINNGVPPEDARFILPNSVETYIIFTMNARELLHFFELRLCARAQWEIRDLAFKMLKLVMKVAPNIFSYAGAACMIGKKCTETKRPIQECRLMWKKVKELKNEILGSDWISKNKMERFPYTD